MANGGPRDEWGGGERGEGEKYPPQQNRNRKCEKHNKRCENETHEQ